jgi:uncharacterized membrane protein
MFEARRAAIDQSQSGVACGRRACAAARMHIRYTFMASTTANEPKRPSSWNLVLSVSALFIAVFFFSFDAGKFYMDRLQRIDNVFSIGMSFAALWTIRTVLKYKPSLRSRVVTLAAIALLLSVPIAGGFIVGKDAQYPARSRALVQKIQEHARQVKSIKEHVGQMRGSFTDPEQLLSIQPLLASWEEHINEIARLDLEIRHDELPSFIAGVLKLMNEGIVFDKRQVRNINDQISAIRASEELSPIKKEELYKQRLIPLMDQEEEIERQRQAANLEQQIKDLPKKVGF